VIAEKFIKYDLRSKKNEPIQTLQKQKLDCSEAIFYFKDFLKNF